MISPRFAVCRDIYLKPFRSNFRLIDHFSKKVENNWNMSYNMEYVSEKYYYFLNKTLHKLVEK